MANKTLPWGILDERYLSGPGVNAQTGTAYTLEESDAGGLVTFDSPDLVIVTVPDLSTGFRCRVQQLGAGQVAFVPDTGVTARNRQSHNGLAGQYAKAEIEFHDATEYTLEGDTASVSVPSAWEADVLFDFNPDSLDATLNDGDPVPSWPSDIDPGTWILAQATAGKRPTFQTGIANGHAAVDLDGVDDGLENPTAFGGGGALADVTVGIVCIQKTNFLAGSSRIINADGNILFALQRNDGLMYYNGAIIAGPAAYALDTVYVAVIHSGSVDSSVHLDGADITDISGPSARNWKLQLGHSSLSPFPEPAGAQVLRLVAWEKELSPTELASFFSDMDDLYK